MLFCAVFHSSQNVGRVLMKVLKVTDYGEWLSRHKFFFHSGLLVLGSGTLRLPICLKWSTEISIYSAWSKHDQIASQWVANKVDDLLILVPFFAFQLQITSMLKRENIQF